jgi:hypothetical protein
MNDRKMALIQLQKIIGTELRRDNTHLESNNYRLSPSFPGRESSKNVEKIRCCVKNNLQSTED